MRVSVAFSIFVAALAFFPLPSGAIAKARPTGLSGAQHLAIVPLTIETAAGPQRFRVELARTPAEQERGLMFRKSLPHDGGMIFPMAPPRVATFWMKNTLIPLDMLFIRADGSIARITTATPLSTDIDDSGEPVVAVLELAGGKAAALGIATNDRVRWQMPR